MRTKPRPPLTKRMRPGHWVALDFVAGAFFGLLNAVAVLGGALRSDGGPLPGRSVVWLAALIVGAGVTLAVGLRRRHPSLMLSLLLAASLVEHLVGPKPIGVFVLDIPTAYVLFFVVATFDGRRAQLSTLAMVGGTFTVHAIISTERYGVAGGASQMLGYGFLLVIAWAGGYIVRQRRDYAVGLQVEAASKAVAQERLRIARELHDVVAHSMSVIAVQAGYGQYVIDSKPADARTALNAIQATSRDALDEMRRMLGALRQADYAAPEPAGPRAAEPAGAEGAEAAEAAEGNSDGAGVSAVLSSGGADGDRAGSAAAKTAGELPDNEPDRAGFARALRQMMRQDGTEPEHGSARAGTANAPLYPAPGLADLERLISRTRGAGVEVRLTRNGPARDLPSSIDLSAYRIIQEALTNVVKHAHTRACDVYIGYQPDELLLRVTDGGEGVTVPSSPLRYDQKWGSSGHGITGMRERVSLLGGEFSAGPLPGYGFQVMARIPT